MVFENRKKERQILLKKRNQLAMNNLENARNVTLKVEAHAKVSLQMELCNIMLNIGSNDEKKKAKTFLSNLFETHVPNLNDDNQDEEVLVEQITYTDEDSVQTKRRKKWQARLDEIERKKKELGADYKSEEY